MSIQDPPEPTTTASTETRTQTGYLRIGWLALAAFQHVSFVQLRAEEVDPLLVRG